MEKAIFSGSRGVDIPYILSIPEGYDPKKSYPLVICLHGGGGRGSDNRGRGVEAYAALSAPVVQEKYPSFLLVPQCAEDKRWVDFVDPRPFYSIERVPESNELATVREILKSVEAKYSIDPKRIYTTGQSMGGHASYDLITRTPNRFAAAIPVCGEADIDNIGRFAHVPLWIFHGAKDKKQAVENARKIHSLLKEAGSTAIYTEFPKVGHSSWIEAWQTPGLIDWLFAQRLGAN